jgi:putative membrane protein
MDQVIPFLVFWGVNTLSLWVASKIFSGIGFTDSGTLWVSGLLLGLVNTFIRPILVFLTLPITILTLGLFLLVINALTLLLVAWIVPGFRVDSFWTGFFVALFVSVFGFVVNSLIGR